MRFKKSLTRPGIRIIAEFKRASPSLGDIAPGADPAERAAAYERGGAAAMSVLCDAARFKGSPDDLRRAASASSLPLLAKDFITAPERLEEVAAAGASAALLIVRYLDDAALAALLARTRELGMDALVETRSEEEIARAVSTRRNEIRMEFYKDDPEGLEKRNGAADGKGAGNRVGARRGKHAADPGARSGRRKI